MIHFQIKQPRGCLFITLSFIWLPWYRGLHFQLHEGPGFSWVLQRILLAEATALNAVLIVTYRDRKSAIKNYSK